MWNVHAATISSIDRTKNVCESWDNDFRHLVGHDNSSLWVLIGCLQKDNAMMETDVYILTKSESVEKQMRKKTVSHQQTLNILCDQYVSGRMSMIEFRAVRRNF